MRSIAMTGKLFVAGLMAIGFIHIATNVTMYALNKQAENRYTLERGS